MSKLAPVRSSVSKKVAVAVVATTPLFALAAEAPEAPDVTAIVTYIGYAVAAIVAIGTAKMIPAAAMWLYSSLTGAVKRG